MLTATIQRYRAQYADTAAYPFLLTFSLGFLLRLFSLLTLLVSPSPGYSDSSAFDNSQIAVKVWECGRYLEVGTDGWIFASTYSHNKDAARFEVEPVDPALVRSLSAAREFKERSGGAIGDLWDVRPDAVSSVIPYEAASFTDLAPPSPPMPPYSDDDEAAQAAAEAEAEAIEAERRGMESARRRLSASARRGDAVGWVLLRSAYLPGYMEVISRGEENEYVVRVAPEGKLSYRSLFLLKDDAIWSYAVGGFLNWRRPTSSEPRQHVRAHGNTEPFRPLISRPPSSRLHLITPPPVTDVLGNLECPTAAPTFDWNLLLDAARAGTCNGAGLPALRRAGSALSRLESELGSRSDPHAYGYELSDLANGYRGVLLENEWVGVLDLQMRPCSELAPDERPKPFSSIATDGTMDLLVDPTQCPRPAYSEVMLRPTPEDPLALDMQRFDAVAAPPDDAATSAAGTDGNASSPVASNGGGGGGGGAVAASSLRATLLTDAAFVICHYDNPNEYSTSSSGDGSSEDNSYVSERAAVAADEGDDDDDDDEGDDDDGFAPQSSTIRQALWFRLSPQVEYFSETTGRKTPRKRRSVGSDGGQHAMFNMTSGAEIVEAPEVAAANAAAEAAAKAKAAVDASLTRSFRLSVLLLQLDATSRSHLMRMVPRSLSLLREMASGGLVTLYDFPHYHIVGYNSLPNMVPMLSGVDAQTLIDSTPVGSYSYGGGGKPPEGVWSAFQRRGYATAMLEELHDGCNDLSSPAPSSATKLFYSRVGASGMPHHNPWPIFCQPELRTCCNDPESFLQPGKRQCVNDDQELPVLLMDYMRQLWRMYSSRDTPRFALLNLMSAHEHFMHRLGALDEPLHAFLLSFEKFVRSDTALFLLSDHGTHGVWYNHFAVGQAEHRAPALTLVLPAGFAQAHPAAHASLLRNQRRTVTAYDLHATFKHLANWPTMPPPSEEATSLFVDLPEDRSCEAAKVPADWCLQSPAQCFDEEKVL